MFVCEAPPGTKSQQLSEICSENEKIGVGSCNCELVIASYALVDETAMELPSLPH